MRFSIVIWRDSIDGPKRFASGEATTLRGARGVRTRMLKQHPLGSEIVDKTRRFMLIDVGIYDSEEGVKVEGREAVT